MFMVEARSSWKSVIKTDLAATKVSCGLMKSKGETRTNRLENAIFAGYLNPIPNEIAIKQE